MILVAIKDTKSVSFGKPSAAVNTDVAIRECKILVNDPASTLVSTYPEDFELFKVGDYDEKTGSIKSDVVFITNLKDLKEVHHE